MIARRGAAGILLGGLLLLAGCAVRPPAPEFAPYLRAFEAAAARHGRPVDAGRVAVTYGVTQPETAVASCFRLPLVPPQVHINRRLWREIEPPCREIYLFHELGHCVLHRLHARGNRLSLMRWNTVSCADYLKRRETYLRELFRATP